MRCFKKHLRRRHLKVCRVNTAKPSNRKLEFWGNPMWVQTWYNQDPYKNQASNSRGKRISSRPRTHTKKATTSSKTQTALECKTISSKTSTSTTWWPTTTCHTPRINWCLPTSTILLLPRTTNRTLLTNRGPFNSRQRPEKFHYHLPQLTIGRPTVTLLNSRNSWSNRVSRIRTSYQTPTSNSWDHLARHSRS